MGIVQSFEEGVDFWADAAVALGGSLPHQTRVVPQGDMGYGVKATVPIEQGSKVVAYLLTGLSYIDPTCGIPVVYSINLSLDKACGPELASWMRSAHRCPWTARSAEPPGLYNARAVALTRTWNILQCTETCRERASPESLVLVGQHVSEALGQALAESRQLYDRMIHVMKAIINKKAISKIYMMNNE